jgi:hypothetical protein
MNKSTFFSIALLVIIATGELNAQDPAHLQVFKSSCSAGNEWSGWVSNANPFFYYDFMAPFIMSEVTVTNVPFGGTYTQSYTFNSGNFCNQWPYALATGRYIWNVRVYFNAGGSIGWTWTPAPWGAEFDVDVTPPNPPVVTDNDCGGSNAGWPAWINHPSPYFTWGNPGDAGSGVCYYKVTVWNIIDLVGTELNNVTSLWHPTYEGRHYFDFQSVDYAGNISSVYRVYVSADNTPPDPPYAAESHCGIYYPWEWSAHTSPYFSWAIVHDGGYFTGNGSGINRYETSVNGGAWIPVSQPWEPVYGTGQYTFRFRSVDNVGLTSDSYSAILVNIDNTAPNAPIVTENHCGGTISANPPWTAHTTPNFTWGDPGDGGSGVGAYQVSVNGGVWNTVTSGWEPEYPGGSYTFDFRSVDRVNHFSIPYRIYVRIQAPARIFVKQNASGSNNGTSWTDAYTDLQSALSAAAANDTIWVAAGTYKPTVDKTGNSSPSDPRLKTFQLVSEVPVIGGFAGTESRLKDRDPGTYETILNGDIGIQADITDNCYSVVKGVNNSTIDGFTVSGGNGNGTVSLDSDLGGGLSNNAVSNVKSLNCTFKNNYSKQGGGAGNFYCADSIIFSNCQFLANISNNGGAIGNWNTKVYVTNCVFAGNYASSATSWGSAIFNWGGGSTSQVNNCTFYNNLTSNSGGVISNRGVISYAANCIFWGNNSNDILGTNGGDCVLTFSCIEQPGYAGFNGNISSNPQFTDAANGDFHLSIASPCIDAGNGSLAPETDLDRNQRFDHPEVVNTGTGDPVYSDMGVYECLLITHSEEAQSEIFRIYPNPSDKIFSIYGPDFQKVEIFNAQGRLIYSNKDNAIRDISLYQQPEGIYFMKIKTGKLSIMKKIIIN